MDDRERPGGPRQRVVTPEAPKPRILPWGAFVAFQARRHNGKVQQVLQMQQPRKLLGRVEAQARADALGLRVVVAGPVD